LRWNNCSTVGGRAAVGLWRKYASDKAAMVGLNVNSCFSQLPGMVISVLQACCARPITIAGSTVVCRRSGLTSLLAASTCTMKRGEVHQHAIRDMSEKKKCCVIASNRRARNACVPRTVTIGSASGH